MEEEKKHMDELIVTYLTEGLDKSALAELKAWIAASTENENYFIQQREVWFSAVSREAALKYNKDKAFHTFKNRIESQKEVEKTSRRGFRLSALWRYAAIVTVILAVGCFSYWQGGVDVKDTFADISVEAPLGSRTKLYLPDGTLVWLNAGSRMTYSQGFGVDNRMIELEGEGYFEVRRNEKLPFFVKTKDLQLQVLGTKFNFRDYPEDHEVVVSLLEGKVELNNLLKKEKEAVLAPDERAILNKTNGLMTVETVTASNASQWTGGYLFFDEELLPDIVKELERSYNVTIRIANDSLNTFRFYGNFVRRPLKIAAGGLGGIPQLCRTVRTRHYRCGIGHIAQVVTYAFGIKSHVLAFVDGHHDFCRCPAQRDRQPRVIPLRAVVEDDRSSNRRFIVPFGIGYAVHEECSRDTFNVFPCQVNVLVLLRHRLQGVQVREVFKILFRVGAVGDQIHPIPLIFRKRRPFYGQCNPSRFIG